MLSLACLILVRQSILDTFRVVATSELVLLLGFVIERKVRLGIVVL